MCVCACVRVCAFFFPTRKHTYIFYLLVSGSIWRVLQFVHVCMRVLCLCCMCMCIMWFRGRVCVCVCVIVHLHTEAQKDTPTSGPDIVPGIVYGFLRYRTRYRTQYLGIMGGASQG